jgi:hypothetical protein
MQREKEYELNHPEEAQKLLNKKKNREKEKKKNKCQYEKRRNLFKGKKNYEK